MELIIILFYIVFIKSKFFGVNHHTIEKLPVKVNDTDYFEETAFTEVYYSLRG